MITVEEREEIRRAHVLEGKSRREIEREMGHGRRAINKALQGAEGAKYEQSQARESPVLGPYKAKIDELLIAGAKMPRKQRYTAHKIYEVLHADGYTGSESGVHVYVWRKRNQDRRPEVFLPLEYVPGKDMQVDWGEALVELNGERVTAQFLEMRLCYSRKVYVRAYPHQRQEAFLEGQVLGFEYFEGVPEALWYDNLKTAVLRILQGHKRQEQRRFTAFRSHYLFETHFCTPAQGHEKGGVENGIGYVRRNLFMPVICGKDWEEINAELLKRCQKDDERRVGEDSQTIGEKYEQERGCLMALPKYGFDSGTAHEVTLTGYSQVVFETNRYSIPADKASKHLLLRAYPFQVQVLDGKQVLATHPRCYERHQEIIDPLHYLSLLEQRPAAFMHAKPMQMLREQINDPQHKTWPAIYARVLAQVQTDDTRGIREFIRILRLRQELPEKILEQAIEMALKTGKISADVVRMYVSDQRTDDGLPAGLDLSQHFDLPRSQQLDAIGRQPIQLHLYDQLLSSMLMAQPEVQQYA